MHYSDSGNCICVLFIEYYRIWNIWTAHAQEKLFSELKNTYWIKTQSTRVPLEEEKTLLSLGGHDPLVLGVGRDPLICGCGWYLPVLAETWDPLVLGCWKYPQRPFIAIGSVQCVTMATAWYHLVGRYGQLKTFWCYLTKTWSHIYLPTCQYVLRIEYTLSCFAQYIWRTIL